MSVFVVQKKITWDYSSGELTDRYDISPAKQYGELVFLLGPTENVFDPRRVVSTLNEKLINFSDQDYLLPMGNPCFIGWATAVAARQNEGCVKLLQWSRKNSRYYVIQAEDL